MKLVKLSSISEVGISHDPNIKKKVMIANGDIPQLTTFATATFKPGDSVETHEHKTMFEVFFILTGKAVFTINGVDYTVEEGDCITIEPTELHSQSNPFELDVTWLYFGIATD